MLGWGPTFFVVLLIPFLRRLVMYASIGLRIEGRPGKMAVDSVALSLWFSGSFQ